MKTLKSLLFNSPQVIFLIPDATRFLTLVAHVFMSEGPQTYFREYESILEHLREKLFGFVMA